jgi:FkbM family methyltransferase
MKDWIKSHLPKRVLHSLIRIRQVGFVNYAKESYSQEGEDMLLDRFLNNRNAGFFVDVGAHHPKRFSNTYWFYRKGWRGVNIDANPGIMKAFQRVRPRDINVEAAVSSTRQELTYYRFNEPALNTFKRDLALERACGSYKIIEEIKIVTVPLGELLDRYVPAGTKIDFLTIDIEGLDYDVLRSNDWSRYSPEFILAECIDASTFAQAESDPVAELLREHHYSMVAKTMHTILFMRTVASELEASSKVEAASAHSH